MAGRLFLGTSGYVYPHWRGRFYPRGLPQREWFSFYARRFDTVELNNPFYRLPAAETFRAWRDAAPAGFTFAVKASRFLTHMKKLRDPAGPLRLFLERARRLEHTLGPVLFQLPGNFRLDRVRLDGFLRALARQRLGTRLRAVLEVRHPSWLEAAATARLESAGVALCLADWRELRVAGPVTAEFVYVRRHGTAGGGPYPEARLRADAVAIREWLGEGRDVYVYFNNDRDAFAVRDAQRLRALLAEPAAAGGRLRPVRFVKAPGGRGGPTMPEKRTVQRARKARRQGKAPTTQAGEFVREEIRHVREGKHGARSPKQAIAIGLSKARRAGVKLPPPEEGRTSARTRRSAERAYRQGQRGRRGKPSARRSRAVEKALRQEGRRAASRPALARQARQAARRRKAA